MKRLVLIATLATLATAKPGTYKETEDFQYSRSSTDEGSKSGFYGAQRGNMGGNYERAHNMDGLAQHQMSGLVRQVEGELGDGSKTKSGSVFTAANSRGMYGSGHYDLSNLEGRNFQEGVSFHDSQSQLQSHSSLTAQSGHHSHSSGYGAQSSGYNAQSAGYNAQSGYNTQSSDITAQSSALNSAAYSGRHLHGSRTQSGYNGYQYLGYNGAENNQQQAENLHAADQYEYGQRQANGHYSQSAYNSQSAYDQSSSNVRNANSYGTNSQTRVISAVPVRIVGRPGTRVAVPIATKPYDALNGAAYEQNSVNSDAEVLSNQNQDNSYKPTGPKHYESSYSYRKQWEKHDTHPVTVLPVVVPTSNSFPKNSELYEDAQSLSAGQQYESSGLGSHRSHSHLSNSYSGYNANANLASLSQSQHQSAFNAQSHRSTSAKATDSSASSQGIYNSANTADTTNQIEDVDSKPKSYHSSYSYHKSWERQGDPYVIKPASSGFNTEASQRLTAASTNHGSWSSQRYGSQYQQAQQNVLNMEDCDENAHIRVARSYNTLQYDEQNTYQQNNENQEILSQQSQNLEDLTQQTQNKWDKIEDLGQQRQNQWDQSEDLVQQTQNKWDKLEDLGQQAQHNWDQSEDLGQQAQNKWDQSEDLGQQSQSKWDKLEDAGQQTQSQWDKFEDGGQQTQNQWDKLEDLGQQTRPQSFNLENTDQQSQSKWDHFDGQQSQLDVGQQLQNTWSQQESTGDGSVGQETQINWDNLNTYTTPNNDKISKPSTDIVPSRERNDNDKKPLFPNLDSHDSNLFGSPTTGSPKEQTVQSSGVNNFPEHPHDPWNMNIPFNSNNKYWVPSDNGNLPAPHNNYNHPWFNHFSYVPQNSEQALLQNNYHNHQAHTYNAWEHHWPSFTESQTQNSRQESSIHHHDAGEFKPSNTAQGTSTLWNLWDKVDAIEKQTISSNKNETEVSQNSFFSHTESNHGQTSTNDQSKPLGNQNKPFVQNYGHNAREPQFSYKEESTPPTSTTKREETVTFSTPVIVNIKPHEGKLSPSDVGRGDIGPEDSVLDNTPQSNSQDISNEFGTQAKPDIVGSIPEHKRYKTPAEIEALSQVLGDGKTTTDSTQIFKESIFSASSHGSPKHTFSITSSTTSRPVSGFDENDRQYQNMGQYGGNTVTVESGKINTFGQTDLQESVNHFDQQSEDFKQENTDKEFEIHKLNAADTILQREQNENNNKPINKVEISENGNIPTQHSMVNNENKTNKPLPNSWNDNTNSPDNIYNSWFHQLPHKPQNRDQTQYNNYNNQRPNNQQLNIGQQNENFGQQSESFGQQSENFGQQSETFGLQREHFEQQTDNFGQQIENLGQQSENLGQNSNQQFESFYPQFDKKELATVQQSENFGQQSESFGQQSENFGQQSENFGQQRESFGQQSENFGQKSEIFEQQSETFGQQSESFGRQRENFGQQSENFELGENFGQQSENLGQSADRQFESFEPHFEKKEPATEEQFEIFEQQVDKFDKLDTELLNSETQKQHKLPNIEISESNMHNTYNQQQSGNWNQNEDKKQNRQTGWELHQNLDEKGPVQETQNLEVIPVEKPIHKIEVPEERAGYKDPTSPSIVTDTPPETEKPGFWKSVGNKFVSAKDKVFSWFGKS
ncbi:uncharacterized protein DDB_G0283357 [Manduca sexta]|uniref:uncharacterized protein DDB_G0283357 n=1 Tax=Manduca sexta TaxID=7130 RepID=UPI00189056F2|nr:uncharacterized protein DDB_G0283357 [Manduca sexta]